MWLPSSHSSLVCLTLSPQVSPWQVALQPSLLAMLESSHCSTPSITPLPHDVSRLTSALQAAPYIVLPSPHCSPRGTCVRPSPQTSTRQVELQPSPETLLWSSHASTPSLTPLPQNDSSTHLFEQPSPEVVLPSSHCSLP